MHRSILRTCSRRNFARYWSYGHTLKSSTASSCMIKDDQTFEFHFFDEEPDKLCEFGQLRRAITAITPPTNEQVLDTRIDAYCLAFDKCINQKNLAEGLELQSLLVNNGHDLNNFVGSYLIRMFGACGCLSQADQVFIRLPEPSVFAWNAIISAHSKHGSGEKSIQLYQALLNSDIQTADSHIYVAVLQACANCAVFLHGKRIYAQIIDRGLDSHIFLVNGIINMYVKCHSYYDASHVFDASLVRDVVTWNVMMEGCTQYGCFHRTLQLFYQMQIEGINPDNVTYINVLQASSMEPLHHGKIIHLLTYENSGHVDAFVGSALINMYCKCCSLDDARRAFNTREVRDVVIWRAMLTGYASCGHLQESCELFCQMQQQEGLEIGKLTYAAILHACSDGAALYYGKILHTYVVESGLNADKELGRILISLYTNCGKLEAACNVFYGLRDRDVVSWTTLMSGYADQAHFSKVFQLFCQMYQEDIQADKVILTTVLKACTQGSNLELGREVHNYIEEEKIESDFCIRTLLVEMYARFEMYKDARWNFHRLFTEIFIPKSSLNVGNVSGLLPLNLYNEIQEGAIVSLLQSCATLEDLEGAQLIHFHFIYGGFEWAGQVIGSLISMYTLCGMLDDAHNVFETCQLHDVTIWCSMIAGYAHYGQHDKASHLFSQMQKQGLQPNQSTFVSMLKACPESAFLKQGRMMHTRINNCNMRGDRVMNSTLIDMYVKCGSLRDAQGVFDKLSIRDTLAWNALIAGYASGGGFLKAFKLLQVMENSGSKPDTTTFVGILKACSSPAVIFFGKLIHHIVYEIGYEFNVSLVNGLINMYSKCGSLDDAEKVFNCLHCRSKVTWGLMIAGHAQSGLFEKALFFFQQMYLAGLTLDGVSIVSALKACSSTGTLVKGMLLHVLVILGELKFNIYLANTLITMYSNCGSLEDAFKVFTCLPLRDTATWNAMIAGCAHNNNCEMAWKFFKDMQNDDVRPDAITFTCVLSACSHMGRVEDGLHQLQCMIQEHGITPTAEHYNCIIDLLGRTGYLLKAEDLLCSLPFLHNYVGWMSLLGHCKLHESTDVGSRCIDYVIKDESRNASGYLLMARIYSHLGHSQEANRVEGLRTDVNAWKQPGMAYIEVNKNTCSFGVQRVPNNNADDKLVRLKLQMKDGGYLPWF